MGNLKWFSFLELLQLLFELSYRNMPKVGGAVMNTMAGVLPWWVGVVADGEYRLNMFECFLLNLQ